MPLSKYFKGDGGSVMKNMMQEYGKDKGKKVFYATAKKRGMEPSDSMKKKHGVS